MHQQQLPAHVAGDPSAWDQALYAFLVEKGNRSGSRRTVESYSRMLWPFFSARSPERVTPTEVLAFAHGIGRSGRTPSSATVGARIACLSSFYRFLIRMQQVSANPCDALERPRSVPAVARASTSACARARALRNAALSNHYRHHASTMHPSRPMSAATLCALVLLPGIAVGIATILGQAVLPGGWNRLANSGAIWLMVAFLTGSIMPTHRWALAAGAGVLMAAVVSYYATAVVAGAGASVGIMAIWIGTALVGGPVYGVGGRWWQGEAGPRRVIATGLAGGIVTAEGVSTLLRIPELAQVGWIEVASGIVVTVLLGRATRERLLGLAIVPAVVVVGVAAYEVIDRVIAAR